jgi:uncharacterized FlgJ-related protein
MKFKKKFHHKKGPPCRTCGSPIRYISTNACVSCSYERSKKFQKINNTTERRKAYMRKYMREYVKNNKERVDQIRKKYEAKKRKQKRLTEAKEKV